VKSPGVDEVTVHIGNAKLFRLYAGDVRVGARVRVRVSPVAHLACRV